MGLGVLEDKVLDHVPGTSYILEDERDDNTALDSRLKYDRSGDVPILLVPQPSDDPNDPLNWPVWWRDLILFALCFVSVLCATTSSLMAANTVAIALHYGKSFTSVALLTGYHLCGVGVAGVLIVPTARVWGKRHLFILGNILMVVSCAWAGGSGQNYQSLLWARIIQGVALAPFEALTNACVGDLFFVHERGKRMALSNVAVFGAAFLTPVLAGKITHSLSWQWTFYLVAIFTAACLPLTFFLIPETAFRRADHFNTDFEHVGDRLDGSHSHTQLQPAGYATSELSQISGEQKQSVLGTNEKPQGEPSRREDGVSQEPTLPRKATYWETLKLFNGRKTDEDFFTLLLRPFPLFFHPGILWACLIQGVLIGWTVFIGVVLAAIFLGPPLWFNEVQTGYLYTGAFIGSILGLILSGILSDSLNKVMIKLNKGKYEPEFRILLVIFQLIFSGTGLYGFGIVAEDVDRHGWLVPDVFFAFVIIGMVMGAVASALYIVDAHRQIAVEAFTCLLIFKNIFSFVLTFFAYDWLIRNGIRPAFLAISSIQVGVCLLSIPMYIFGKRNRSFFTRYNILKKLHLWPGGVGYQTQDRRTAESPVARPSPEGYKAAITAVRDRRAITSLPPVATGFKYDISTTSDQAYDVQRESSDRDKALRAATGAYRLSRKRADSAPSKPTMAREAPYAASAAGSAKPAPEVEGPLARIDSSMEASRIHHMSNVNAQLYTEHPPIGLEEQDRKDVLRAAVTSMAHDMYEITEKREEVPTGEPSAALYGAQRGLSRMRSQRAVPKSDPAALKQAVKVQEAAQQRAAEKLAKINEPTYQEYYGVEPHVQRPTLSIRRRRASVDSETSAADAERSREIRHQMSSLRSRLDAVDEQRTKDRANLMEAARRNVTATIQDMEMRVYHETGRPPPSMQKEWEEAALERAQREVQEQEPYRPYNKVNIGTERYIDMADVEAVARSRLQPTFDEITDRAEKQRARELEARLDAEERERYEAITRERERETRAEEKRQLEIQKRQMKEKTTEEKTWSWWRKSKRTRDTEQKPSAETDYRGPSVVAPAPAPQPTTPPVEAASQVEAAPAAEAPQAEAPQAEAPQIEAPKAEAPQAEPATTEAATQAEAPVIIDTAQPQPAEDEAKIVALGTAGEEEHRLERRESRLKSWFKGRVGRRSNGAEHESLREGEGEGARTGFAGGAALAGTDSRGAALGSHPVTGNDLATVQQRMSVDEGSLGNDATRRGSSGVAEQTGENRKPSRLRSSFMKIVSGGSQDNKTNGVSKPSDDHRTASEPAEIGVRNPEGSNASTATKEELRESAAEHGLPAPPAIGKHATNGSRESRFSEDL
ncbi:hypothetical protein KXW70_009571 [Aspergillus fumigatus]|nr:hypothetical protein KXW70_009571 [Aspergillus fumigatus]